MPETDRTPLLPALPGFDRRALIAAAAAACLPVSLRAEMPALVSEGDGLSDVVDPSARVSTPYEGGRWCEGPVWVPRLDGLVFSDVRSNRMLFLPGEDGVARVFREPSANANGNALDAQGRLITCEHRTARVVRAEPDGAVTVLADGYEGRRLNSPNDVVVARDGALWFTDPTYGIDNAEEGVERASEQPGRFVFRRDADGRLDAVAERFVQPNGLAFSPDEETLYVSETGGRGEIRAFDVADGRRLTRERVFARLDEGVPDGLKTDEDGRLYAGCSDGARIWQPDGRLLGRIATPGPCANIAFGGHDGRRLYLCAASRVHAIRLKVRGAGFS